MSDLILSAVMLALFAYTARCIRQQQRLLP